MHWTRQSSIYVYLTIGTLLFLEFYSFFQFSQFKKYTQYVEHTYKVMNSTERLKASILKLVTLRRGYIIEQTPEGKEQILSEGQSLDALTDSLEWLIIDNPVQNKNIRQIRELIGLSGLHSHKWFDTNETSIPVDSMKADIRRVKPLVENAFVTLDKMREIEDNFLIMRNTLQSDSGGTVPALLLLTGLMAITILLYAFYLLSIDFKARLGAEIALEKNVQDLHLANEELERFAFIASHNLKEPLRKARTFISRVLERESSTDNKSPELNKVEMSLGRLQTMLDDLLTYTNLLQHQENKELVDLNKVIKAVSAEFEDEITEHGLSINTALLPTVNGYSPQIALVFRHLFSNSIKYRKDQTNPVITITTNFDVADATQVIVFSDNGIGFDTKYMQKIFEVFGRLHSKDAYEGNGIGLAICRRAMLNHGGSISADSKPGVGSCFYLYFPC